ncbi:MOSC domain-containing protein [Streptomyces kanamyceticus]|uniref:MOSC domain-containing protein n=1 Tax=Streptomyces kanamyceticus TaxID=1967 RepID=A0A5J6GEU5_STRKN|nr:MOSC domain-containing protein [Streptomyces kanamyceticus]QEU92385.1 MOSC domain-containing protein [Streptomyces kanamyceticus]
MKLLSVNLGRRTAVEYTDASHGLTGIDKKPTDESVLVTAPGVKGVGGSGLVGDEIGNLRHHGGHDQAVYAFAREDLDVWQDLLGRPLANGGFGENVTTSGIDVSGARIGERWRIGSGPLLEVTSSRIPCRTFQGHLDEKGWVKRFTRHGVPGAYLRVIEPGEIRAGDPVEIVHRPAHEVTVALHFRAVTTERSLLPRMLDAADALHPETVANAREYVEKYGAPDA